MDAITGNYAFRDEGLSPDAALPKLWIAIRKLAWNLLKVVLDYRERIDFRRSIEGLFDEDVPHKLARCLGVKNGALLALTEHESFNVFLTGQERGKASSGLKAVRLPCLIMSAINCQ